MKKQENVRVGVFCGGDSNEREISLLTGSQVANALISEGYPICIIQIESDGKWMLSLDQGKRYRETSIQKVSEYIDVAFLALHGKYGEDGTIQNILDLHNIKYTGSGSKASAIGMDKEQCARKVSLYGIKVPKTIIYKGGESDLDDIKKKVNEMIGFPCIVKPNASGSSVGVALTKDSSMLKEAVVKAKKEDDKVIIQQYIQGREFSCGVLGNRKSEKIVLPVVEICPKDHEFFDYEAKYQEGETDEVCPARIEKGVSDKLQDLAKKVHMTLECDGLTRSDFILDSHGNIFFLEINTIPGQAQMSLCPKEATVLGWSFSEFVEKQIQLALE
jgi:D-alanine-D-alanine ligase